VLPLRDGSVAYDGRVSPSPPFRGWRIVGLGLIANAIGAGVLGAYAFMVTPLIEEFGATPAQLGLGMSITIASMALASPILGRILDRGRLRLTMLSGVLVMLVAMGLLSRGQALWQLAVCLSAVAIGLAMFGMLPAKVLIVNWFVRKRGRALAIAFAGTSLAGFVMPPITAWLIELFSWRTALVWIALGAAALATPAIAFFAIRRPEDIGQYPDGDPAPPGGAEEVVSPRLPHGRIVRDRNFWVLGVGDALAMSVPVATGLFFVRHLEEVGIPRTTIALVMPLMACCSLAGKLTVGTLADRVNPRLLAIAMLVLHVIGLWIVAVGTGVTAMIVAALPIGFGGGGFFPLPSVLQGRCFGRLIIGQVSGLHSLLGLPLLLVSAPLTGMVAASTGSFLVPFVCLGLLQLLAAGILVFLRVPDEEPSISLFVDEPPRADPLAAPSATP